jgi:YegS/Rv2252/BmrU family lipid kinase
VNKAVVIHNPMARNAKGERIYAAAGALKAEGWEVEVRPTEAAGHATVLAREAAEAGARTVFASGGDGTMNEVLNGLVGTPASLGIVRGGMGNVFAKEVGIPRNPEAALRLLLTGVERRFDLGVANGRYFILMAGAGFDGTIVERVPARAKRLLGSTSYALWGGYAALSFRKRHAGLRIDGARREQDLYWLLVSNTRSYGGVVEVAREALVDDGLLDCYAFAGEGAPWVVRTGLQIAVHRQDAAKGVEFFRTREVAIETPGFRVQADGEDFGETPMTFSVAPGALSVLLPPEGGRKLFSR